MFAGGWTLSAADAVCGDDDPGDESLPGTLWTLLDGLTDKSLLMTDETDTQTRYKLLETVRQYAEWHLAACGQELGATRDRHQHWCVALVDEADPHLSGPEQGAWVAQLEREHDNLRAVLGWAREQGSGARALRLAGALCRFWQMRGYLDEGRSHLDAALHEESLALRRTLGDKMGIADSLHHLGVVAYRRRDHVRADALLAEAVLIGHATGARDVVAESLEYLSWVGAALGLHERAARVSAAAEILRQALGIRLMPADQAGSERALRSIRATLGKQALAATVAEVRRLLPDQAILRTLAVAGDALEERLALARGMASITKVKTATTLTTHQRPAQTDRAGRWCVGGEEEPRERRFPVLPTWLGVCACVPGRPSRRTRP